MMQHEEWAVLENLITGQIHAMPYFELQQHIDGAGCPCNPIIDISAEVNGGRRIYRHNKRHNPQ